MGKLVALVFLLFSSAAFAGPITWHFEGHTAGPGMPGGICQTLGCRDILNDISFSGRLTFDDTAPDADDSAAIGVYRSSGGPYGIHVDIGPYTFDMPALQIGIATAPYVFGPQFIIFGQASGVNAIGLLNCYEPFTAMQTALPGAPPPISELCPEPSYIRTAGGADVAFRLTEWHAAPEPSSIALLGLALLALRRYKRLAGVNRV